MNDDKVKGKMDEMKGKAKQAVGDLTDDRKRQAEGEMDEAKGKARQKIGEAKDFLDKEEDRR